MASPWWLADYAAWEHRAANYANLQVKAVAAVPLKSGDQVVGTIGLAYDAGAGRTFGDAEVEFLSRFAELASLALDNARLFGENLRARAEAEDQARRLALLNEMGQQMSLAGSANEIFKVITDFTSQIVPAGRVSLTLLTDAGDSLEIFALQGMAGKMPLGKRLPLTGTFQWLDIEKDGPARELVAAVNGDRHQLPVLFFPDGSVLVDPDNRTLAEKVGLRTQATQPFYDLIVIGGGPAGLAAGVYGASEGLRTILIEREAVGGQAGTSSRIENYLGFPKGLSGADLARRAIAQATRLGAEILTAQEVTQVRVEDPYRFVTLSDGTELSCHALLIATGVSVRKLNVPGIEAVTGAGAYYGAALTEAAHYQGEHVVTIGGANSAGQGAMFFSRYVSKVTILVRSSTLEKGMSQYLVDQINGTENIEVRLRTSVAEVIGTDRLKAIVIKNQDIGETEIVPAAAMFIFIGAKPHTDLVAGVVERNRAGFILTGSDLIRNGRRPKNWRLRRDPLPLETSVPGIFAAGDVRQGAVRRVASAVGQGSVAVSLIHQYLETV